MNDTEDEKLLNCIINEPVELNLAFMPYLTNGGLFIPTFDAFSLGDNVVIDLQLPGKKENLKIKGKVVWITPQNALHQVIPGVGVQFTGNDAPAIRSQLELQLDKTMDIGGYTYGLTQEKKMK